MWIKSIDGAVNLDHVQTLTVTVDISENGRERNTVVATMANGDQDVIAMFPSYEEAKEEVLLILTEANQAS